MANNNRCPLLMYHVGRTTVSQNYRHLWYVVSWAADGWSGCSLAAAHEDIQSYCGRNIHTQHKPFFKLREETVSIFFSPSLF